MRFGIEGFAQMSDLTSLRALNVSASPADDFTQEPLSGYNVHGLLLLSRMDHLTSLDVSNWPINNDGGFHAQHACSVLLLFCYVCVCVFLCLCFVLFCISA